MPTGTIKVYGWTVYTRKDIEGFAATLDLPVESLIRPDQTEVRGTQLQQRLADADCVKAPHSPVE